MGPGPDIPQSGQYVPLGKIDRNYTNASSAMPHEAGASQTSALTFSSCGGCAIGTLVYCSHTNGRGGRNSCGYRISNQRPCTPDLEKGHAV